MKWQYDPESADRFEAWDYAEPGYDPSAFNGLSVARYPVDVMGKAGWWVVNGTTRSDKWQHVPDPIVKQGTEAMLTWALAIARMEGLYDGVG